MPIEEKWEPIPDYGDLMTVEEWIEGVRCGGFTDYDGWGKYVKDDMMSSTYIAAPSDFQREGAPEGFTHVCWFNR